MNAVTDKLLKSGESERVEFVASAQSRDAVARSVCAMLNQGGGTILMGVDDSGAVVGQYTDQDAAQLRNFLRDNITPQILFSVNLDQIAGGRIVVVDVPVGVDQPYVYAGSIYVRQGRQTVKADAEAMRRMVANQARKPERWERQVASGLGLSDLAENLIRETVRNAEEKRGYSFTNSRDQKAILEDLSLYRSGALTNAADVLFGRLVALRQPQTRLRAVRYESDKGGKFIDERLFEGPAFDLLEKGMSFLKNHVAIGAEFPAERLQRESRPEYPFEALREGLINALAHRDYASFGGSVVVSVYPKRLDIWNSGCLPEGLTENDLRREEHASILVNPDISHVFYLHEFMERVGRGTYKIVRACRTFGMRAPKWTQDSGGVRLRFFAGMQAGKAIWQMNPRQEECLRVLKPGAVISARDFMDRFAKGVSERQARRDLADMESAGCFEKRGLGPRTEYVRTERQE
jgi:ATP-dependent DNA helicase RecG